MFFFSVLFGSHERRQMNTKIHDILH